MKKNVKVAIFLLIVVLIAFFYLLYGYYSEKEKVDTRTPQQKIDDWVKAGGRVTDGVYDLEIGNFVINDDGKTVILYDKDGNPIFFTPIDDLVEAIEIGKLTLMVEGSLQVPDTSAPPPAPAPVPVPIPVPIPPVTEDNETNVTVPSPTPVPTPPNATPSPGPYLPACSNGQWDGDESDLDCGGSCAPCLSSGLFTACWENSDCATGNCGGIMPLPIDYKGTTYSDYSLIRILAGDTGIIQFQGRCQ
ncbi:MAG: hypothetical protein KAT77_04490 [Nanoarchaeota archaeon]|nr:hypothetical protein [Nanoarchaeota archaeon]